jgi:hypothetical protein
MRLISRDPEARTELHRDFDWSPSESGCTWCNGTNASPAGNKYLWKYLLVHDDRPSGDGLLTGRFCCDDCLFSYHPELDHILYYDDPDERP